jgi:hypothetical protein
MHLGASYILGRVGRDPPVDVGEAVVAADRRQTPVDRRGSQAPLLEGTPVELDVRSGRLENGDADVVSPLEEGAQVVTVGVEGAAAVAGEKRGRSELGVVKSWDVRIVARVGRRLEECVHG